MLPVNERNLPKASFLTSERAAVETLGLLATRPDPLPRMVRSAHTLSGGRTG